MPLSDRELDALVSKVFDKLKVLVVTELRNEFVSKTEFEEVTSTLKTRLDELETTKNKEIEGLQTRVKDLESELKTQKEINTTNEVKTVNLKWRMEDRTNRDLRNNLVFVNVPQDEKYNKTRQDKTKFFYKMQNKNIRGRQMILYNLLIFAFRRKLIDSKTVLELAPNLPIRRFELMLSIQSILAVV